MQFKTASAIESLVWELRLSDFPRSLNRSKIDALFEGFPPYSDQEVQDNSIDVNINWLEGSKLAHDVRAQLTTAMLTPDPLFTVNVDYGPLYRRRDWGDIITTQLNRIIKKSLTYMEVRRSTFASLVLHGIGPAVWQNKQNWCPQAIGVEDALIPSGTLLTMENLPFFAIYQQYTGFQLKKMISGPQVDPGWNVPLAESAIKWVDQQASQLMSSSWPEVWSPEKWVQREKEDSGLWSSDRVPTVDCFDFYFWNDDGKRSGWERRIVLDAYGQPGAGGTPYAPSRPSRKFNFGDNDFLYDSSKKKRSVFADKRDHIIHFQFADGSNVAPFRYHTVRSLGFLLYSVLQMQNRLRCKFNEAVFESLLQYFRVHSMADAERAIKINLINRGIIPDGVEFVPVEQRWKVQEAIVEMCFEQNRQTIQDQSSSYMQDLHAATKDTRETATKTMAKVNAGAALVGAMLSQAYNYQQFQYQEIGRRFTMKNSRDADVREFRVQCLKRGVPEEALDICAWDIQTTKVLGDGNNMLQQQIAQALMGIRQNLDPTAQKKVDRIYISAFSKNYELANDLVPEQPQVSDSRHDAQLALGALLQGIDVQVRDGVNHVEVIEELLKGLAQKIAEVEQTGGMATPQQIQGFNNVAAHIGQHIQILAQNPQEKQRVKVYGDDLGKLMNLVKAYQQRLQEAAQQQAQANGGGGIDPKDAAKIQGTILTAKTKAQLAAQSHAQRTAQRQLQFEQQMKQREQEHALDMQKDVASAALDIHKNRLKSLQE